MNDGITALEIARAAGTARRRLRSIAARVTTQRAGHQHAEVRAAIEHLDVGVQLADRRDDGVGRRAGLQHRADPLGDRRAAGRPSAPDVHADLVALDRTGKRAERDAARVDAAAGAGVVLPVVRAQVSTPSVEPPALSAHAVVRAAILVGADRAVEVDEQHRRPSTTDARISPSHRSSRRATARRARDSSPPAHDDVEAVERPRPASATVASGSSTRRCTTRAAPARGATRTRGRRLSLRASSAIGVVGVGEDEQPDACRPRGSRRAGSSCRSRRGSRSSQG